MRKANKKSPAPRHCQTERIEAADLRCDGPLAGGFANAKRRETSAGFSSAAARIDLLSVIAHERGHMRGLDCDHTRSDDFDVMDPWWNRAYGESPPIATWMGDEEELMPLFSEALADPSDLS